MFHTPMINLYARDLERAQAFYQSAGFRPSFRTPPEGTARHVELTLDGFRLGIATIDAAAVDHGLRPGDGRAIEIVLWTDDADAAAARMIEAGATLVSPPHDFLDGRLRAAWVSDPEGNPIQLVARRTPPN